jgi:hypothetical protein
LGKKSENLNESNVVNVIRTWICFPKCRQSITFYLHISKILIGPVQLLLKWLVRIVFFKRNVYALCIHTDTLFKILYTCTVMYNYNYYFFLERYKYIQNFQQKESRLSLQGNDRIFHLQQYVHNYHITTTFTNV